VNEIVQQEIYFFNKSEQKQIIKQPCLRKMGNSSVALHFQPLQS